MKTYISIIFNILATILAFLLLSISGLAMHIVKTPGSTTNVFTDLPIQDVSNADTLFIEGGSGNIYLQAGASDDGSPYNWTLGTIQETTYTTIFSYNQPGSIITTEGYAGCLCSVSRSNPEVTQNIWIFYRGVPTKPTTPIGSNPVCAGSTSIYSTSSTNAENYEWYITPVEAGILTNETTNTLTVDWDLNFEGIATISVKGINGEVFGSLSDELNVSVNIIPVKPEISGDSFVKIGNTYDYYGSFTGISNWIWTLYPPEGIATSSTNANHLTLTFQNTGIQKITLQTENNCGLSSLSDTTLIEIIDPYLIGSLYAQIETLTDENNQLLTQIDELASDTSEYGTIVRSLTQQVYVLENENLLLTADNTKLVEENALLNGQINELTALVEELNKTTDSLNTIIYDLTAQVENQDVEIADLQNQIEEQIALNNELQLEVEILNYTNDYLQSENDRLTKENKDLVKENETLNDSIKSMLTELEVLRKVYILQWSVENVTTQVFETAVGDFSISLYPNPSPGEVNIQCSEIMKELKIIDIQGQVITEMTVNNTFTSFTANRSEMPVGTYFIRIVTSKGIATHKIIIIP